MYETYYTIRENNNLDCINSITFGPWTVDSVITECGGEIELLETAVERVRWRVPRTDCERSQTPVLHSPPPVSTTLRQFNFFIQYPRVVVCVWVYVIVQLCYTFFLYEFCNTCVIYC